MTTLRGNLVYGVVSKGGIFFVVLMGLMAVRQRQLVQDAGLGDWLIVKEIYSKD